MFYFNNKKKSMAEKGSAVLIVLGLLAMLTGVALISVDRSNTDMDLSDNQTKDEKAFYLAEAGIARATAELNKDNDWRNGYYRQLLESGNYTISLVDSTDDLNLRDTVIVAGEGIYHEGVSKMQSWVVPVYQYPFRYAMFADEGLTLMQGACTDSYNSDSGGYSLTVLNDGADVGSNDTISLSQDAVVGGDASSADSGGIYIGPGSQVLGDTTTAVDSVILDTLPDSEFDWAESNSNAPAGLSGTNYTYNNGSKALNLKADGKLILQSGVYYFSDIQLQSNAEIILAPGASVTVYLQGNLTMQQYSKLNYNGSPADFAIYSKGNAFSMFQNTEFYGAFYGPHAVYKGRQDMGLYGSIVASGISLHQNTCFHYDRSLAEFKGRRTGKMISVAWRLTE